CATTVPAAATLERFARRWRPRTLASRPGGPHFVRGERRLRCRPERARPGTVETLSRRYGGRFVDRSDGCRQLPAAHQVERESLATALDRLAHLLSFGPRSGR